MSIAEADLTRPKQAGEEHALAGAALMHREDERIPSEVVNLVAESEPGPRSRVGLIAECGCGADDDASKLGVRWATRADRRRR
jgi:hypothetical protein